MLVEYTYNLEDFPIDSSALTTLHNHSEHLAAQFYPILSNTKEEAKPSEWYIELIIDRIVNFSLL